MGRPVVALLVHRCCLHWGMLEASPPSLEEEERIVAFFEHLVGLMSMHTSDEGVDQEGNGSPDIRISHLAYW